MKASELRKKQLHELNSELVALLKAHFGLRMQLATQQLSNTKQLKLIKKDIARVKTVITQKLSNHDK
ncbi:50S ribosomal protein L29 [Nitrosomonas sp. Nm166]|uniref:50S ribosomal protein L29 n=1 Tax=Nitrosomonas sp. Nm166 TaxID=1881054 RepID=UPI0008E97B79|nr:50S ribosomal protein L29 [Nitrosomonas sp. Nm166]SFE87431.1 large subunit ribosomal protein L29 [Nitrosomonas sp. Nm166]